MHSLVRCADQSMILASGIHPVGEIATNNSDLRKSSHDHRDSKNDFCEIWRVPFSPSLDDFSGRPASAVFLENLENAYIEMREQPPSTAKRIIEGMQDFVETDLATHDLFSRL